jgi:hypothetical protein
LDYNPVFFRLLAPFCQVLMPPDNTSEQVLMETAQSAQPQHASHDIHGALDFVRLRPEFQVRKEDTFWQDLMKEPWVKDLKKQLNDVLDAVGDLMSKAFSGVKFPEIKPETPWFDQVFAYAVYIALVLLALFLFYLVLSFIKNSLGRQKPVAALPQSQTKPLVLHSSQHYFQEAQKAWAAQQWSEVSRLYYWAGLSLLNEKAYLSLKANRTNREYVTHLKNAQKQYAVSPFESLVKPFEKNFYGGIDLTQQEAETSLQAWQSLQGTLSHKGRPEKPKHSSTNASSINAILDNNKEVDSNE